MDLEQITKRLEWLDEERRRDKTTIAMLEDRLVALENRSPSIEQQVKDLNSDLTRSLASLSRFDQIDAALAQVRVEFNRLLDAAEKSRGEREREQEKIRRDDLEALNRAIGEVRKGLDPIPELRKGVQARMEEEFRLGRLISELEQKMLEGRRSDEEYRRALRLLEEGGRQDAKRLTDLQGEVAAFRKRLDEQRGKVDLSAEGIRKLELRLTEIQAAESERRQAQTAFIEKQSLAIVERERIWKEWQTRFEIIEKQAINLDSQLQMLDSTHRSVKRSQESFDEITQRFERRINEITEMQRLVEDRFRQEWVAFKADDQKRWTNYTLAQEEQQREIARQFERLNERLVLIEDRIQEMQDTLHLSVEEAQKRLQALLALSHEWVENYDRTFGRGR